jgi:hypothetical protein
MDSMFPRERWRRGEAVTPRFTSGREPWVFRALSPEHLCGYHPELIAEALGDDEPVHYMIYSPLYEAEGGRFGIRGPCGSHAVAVTSGRVLVSRDPHHAGASRSLRAVPFDRVRWIELGQALALGWVVIWFLADGVLESETVFFPASGIHHFQAAVRVFRRRGPEPASPHPYPGWEDATRGAPPYLRHGLEPLALQGEQPLVVFQSSERWGTEGRGRRPRCVCPAGLCVLSDRALLWLESERPSHPGDLVFGINATVFDRDDIKEASAGTRVERGLRVRTLALDVRREPGPSIRKEIPLDDEWAGEAERAVQLLTERVVTTR